MSEEIPGMFTVQLYSKSGIARVVGVIDEKIQKSLISYILEMKGEKENDWYRFYGDEELFDVIKRAFELDNKALVYQVEVGDGENIDMAGKYTVLFCLFRAQDGEAYKLSVMKESGQKAKLEHFISLRPIRGRKLGDWYLVYSSESVDSIIEYAKGNDVNGVTYNLVIG